MFNYWKSMWLRAKTLRVLIDEYAYNPAVPGFQAGVFSGSIKHAVSVKGNERDAAALFMMAQIGLMSDPTELDESGKAFVRRVRDQIWFDWDKLVIQDTLQEMMDHLDNV